MAWVERIVPSDQDEQFESWRKEFQQERLLRIVREREIMKETAKRCKSYKIRTQEANDALERKRQAILAQRKAATVQATMRFQRNLPGFTVMDPDKFDRAIETITGRQLTNRSTPRRTTNMQQQQQQQRFQSNTTFRRSISMEDVGSRQPISNHHRIDQRNQTMLTRTNSVTHVPQYVNQIQYTSPLQEVQRRVLNDFAAQIQTTLHQQEQQFDEVNTWEYESVDSLEVSNNHHPQQIIPPSKITGPIVPSNRIVNIQSKKSNTSAFESTVPTDQQDLLTRSYHESFFVKNTPVTGEEQVTAWLGVNKTPATSNKHVGIIEKPPSYDGNDSETNAKRKSILKRSPSVDSNNSKPVMNTKPVAAARKVPVPQARTVGDKVRVKDSLEVINAKLLKELDIQKKTVRFAQDSNNERCASDTQLVKQSDMDNEQTPLRRVQSAVILTPPNRHPIKQTSANDDRASECSSTTSSKPPVYPLTPTSQTRNGYTNIGLKQRELRAKLHKTRYAQSLRQTNSSPMSDSSSSRHTPTLSSQIPMPITPMKTNERRTNDDDENDSLFSELRMSSIPSNHFNQHDARLPPPVPSSKIVEPKLNGTKNATLQTHTTLSIEERRVQESIDRLDRQLKDVQTRTRSTSGSRLQKNQKR